MDDLAVTIYHKMLNHQADLSEKEIVIKIENDINDLTMMIK